MTMITKWGYGAMIGSSPPEIIPSINWLFQSRLMKYGERSMLMEKQGGSYHSISWNEVAREVKYLSLGLNSLGVAPGDRISLMMETQAYWVIWDLAILASGAVNVPIYPNSKAPQIAHILGDASARVIILGSESLLAELARAESPDVCVVIVPDGTIGRPLHQELSEYLETTKQVLEMQQVRELGVELEKQEPDLFKNRWTAVGPVDLASIIYTSGTTGNPKGVMLTHSNFLSNAQAGLEVIPVYDHYVSLSFLPLSHVLERTAGYYIPLLAGSTIAYAENMNTIAENMLGVRPHFLISVPRVYEKIYERVLETVRASGALKRKIFFWATAVAQQNAELVAEQKRPKLFFHLKLALAEMLVFKKIKKPFGGRLLFCISGGAPLRPDLIRFFNGMNIRVLEGYGLTETSPVIACNALQVMRYGSVGRPLPGTEISIADDGEILTKGPQNCLGYYNNPTATRELFTGVWLRTGDIGYLDEDNFLYITDRKKDIIITSGGKNVAPQPLEGILAGDQYISQAIIYGDRRHFLVAILVPDVAQLRQFAARKGLKHQDNEHLVSLPEIRDLLAARVAALLGDYPSFLQVKRLYLRATEFTMEEGEVTPTLKLRRKLIYEKYQNILDSMFGDQYNGIKVDYHS